ncbi:fumarylacetoacetate hydrolase family protein [Arthrobacter sp. 35W]|uniref:fumarylacetoacetate hydrolase family protein n=1 Tax=Arthrobacter sp. 35W TaxID=1132441 RepID=UPI00041E25DB|nr:fumarylacetoacetate hydrolase family protein [Arthrobacter sp. 35W]
MQQVDEGTIGAAGKVLAVHVAYWSRADQRGRTPALPSYFLKPSSSLSLSGGTVERPAGCELLAFEGEVALVIGTAARRVSPEDAWSYVGFVTASNDLGVYDLKYADKGSNVRSKGGDGFTPLGPALIPAAQVAPDALRVRTWINGSLVQDDTTGGLIFPFAQIIADLSQLMTLEPGDVILTGTPAGSSVAVPGDVVEVEVDSPAAGLATGRLRTTVTQGTIEMAEFGNVPRSTEADVVDAYGSEEVARAAGALNNGVLAPAAPQAQWLTADGTLDPALKARLAGVATATLSAQLRKRGLDNVSIDGLQSTRPDRSVVGLARTLRYVPNREDLFKTRGGGFNAQKRAIDSLNEGEILVMEARGEKGTGTVGDILALRAQVKGAAAIITDGGVRDLTAVAGLEMPTYFANAHPAVLGRRHIPWDVDLTIACGGTTVQPGDIIVADADGILVIPPAMADELANDSIAQEHEETYIAEMVAAGHSVDGLYPMNAAWAEKYREWATIHPLPDYANDPAEEARP